MYFSNKDEFDAFEIVIQEISDNTWSTNPSSIPTNYPLYVSFSIVPNQIDTVLIIPPDDIKDYLDVERFIVNPVIYSMDKFEELDILLRNIFKEIRFNEFKINVLGVE